MFDDLSELNDYESEDPFYHTNFLNKLSSNLDSQQEVNFHLPPIEKRSQSIPPPVQTISTPVSISISKPIPNQIPQTNNPPKEIISEPVQKRNSIPTLQSRVSNAITTINESYRKPWKEGPKKLVVLEVKNQVLGGSEFERKEASEGESNKAQTNSPLKIIKPKSTKLVQQVYFNANNVKRIDETLMNYGKLRIEPDIVKLQEIEQQYLKRQSSTPIGEAKII